MKRLFASVLLLSFLTGVSSCKKQADPSQADLSGIFYSHGEDGYFSMLDEGYTVPVRDQGPPGACGAYASASAIQRNILYTSGVDFDVDPADVIIDSCGVDKTEGLRLTSENYYETAYSGPVDIEWAMADGYDGYTLIAAPTYYGMPNEEISLEMIQDAVRTYGGVTAIMQISTPKVNGWHNGYYTVYDNGTSINHVVNIIGYDDHFPADCFDGQVSSDGAWLVQNSFGESWGNSGYFWLSYESNIRFVDTFSLSNRYSEVISYASGAEGSLIAGEDTTVGCIYDHSGSIGGVGTYLGWYQNEDGHMSISSEEVSVTVEVRTADLSEVLYSQDAAFDMGGYYVVEFDTPVEVDGEFAVVVTYHNSNFAPLEGASNSAYNTQMEYITSCEPGNSFIYYDDQWLDLADPATSEYMVTRLIEEGIWPEASDAPETIQAMSEPATDPYINVLFV